MRVLDAQGGGGAPPDAGTATCPICGAVTSERCLQDRPDHEYGLAQTLIYWRCAAQACRHVFSSPMPSTQTIAGLYDRYSTHAV